MYLREKPEWIPPRQLRLHFAALPAPSPCPPAAPWRRTAAPSRSSARRPSPASASELRTPSWGSVARRTNAQALSPVPNPPGTDRNFPEPFLKAPPNQRWTNPRRSAPVGLGEPIVQKVPVNSVGTSTCPAGTLTWINTDTLFGLSAMDGTVPPNKGNRVTSILPKKTVAQ